MQANRKHTAIHYGGYLVIVMLVTSFFLLFPHVCIYSKNASPEDSIWVKKQLKRMRDSPGMDPRRMLVISQQILDFSNKADYAPGKVIALMCMGSANGQELGETKTAINEYLQAIAICKAHKYTKNEATSLLVLGQMYDRLGIFDKAFASYQEAVDLYYGMKDSSMVASGYKYFGASLKSAGHIQEAVKYHLRALELNERLHNAVELEYNYEEIGSAYAAMKDYKHAFYYLLGAVRKATELNDTTFDVYQSLATCYKIAGKFDSAKYYYAKSLHVAIATNDKEDEGNTLLELGSLYLEQNKLKEAEEYEKRGLAIAIEVSNLEYIQVSTFTLAEIYAAGKNFAKAYEYSVKASVLKDSMTDINKQKAITEMQVRFDVKEVEQKNLTLEKENSFQKVKLQRKDILLYGGGAFLLLLASSGFLLLRHRKLKANQKLMELEQKQLLAQINPHFIFNCLNSIQQFVVQNDTINANRYLADFAMLMRQTLNNSKDGIISLSREIEYLENYLSFEHMRFEDKFTYSIACDQEINTDDTEIPSMIIQPFVENAIRHGLCSLQTRMGILKISFYIRDKFLYCEVDDNGIGIEEAKSIRQKGFIKYQSHGMDLTQRRLALVSKMHSEDYKITIVNKTGADGQAEGTTIIIKFPYQA